LTRAVDISIGTVEEFGKVTFTHYGNNLISKGKFESFFQDFIRTDRLARGDPDQVLD